MSGNDGVLEKLRMIFPGHRRMRRLEGQLESIRAELAASLSQMREANVAGEASLAHRIGEAKDGLAASQAEMERRILSGVADSEAKTASAVDQAAAGVRAAVGAAAADVRGLVSELKSGCERLRELVERVRAEGHDERMATAENYEKFLSALRDNTQSEVDRVLESTGRIENAVGELCTAVQDVAAGETSLADRIGEAKDGLAAPLEEMERRIMSGVADSEAKTSAAADQAAAGVLAAVGEATAGVRGLATELESGCERLRELVERLHAEGRDERVATAEKCEKLLSALHDDTQSEVDRVVESTSRIENAVGEVRTAVMGATSNIENEVAKLVTRGEEIKSLVERVRVEGHDERVITAENYERFMRQLRSQASEESSRIVAELFKNEIRCRWQVVDALDTLLFPSGTAAKCPICGYSAAKETFAVKTSECIFGGGRLERYVCPECGAIFGPLKMMALSDTQLAEEYKQSYSVYSESDCTMLEKMAFEALHPEKGKKYLNYGAGAWNRTTKDLRAEGYDVYDFEPYAPAESNPWVIRSIDELKKQKFDGIFSNDLIEHLRNPVEDLKAMKKLLKPGAGMVHCSGCYEYAFEYTRFHLFFLTGGSLERLCEEAGLVGELSDRLFDYSPARICVFRRSGGRRE